MLLVKVMYLVIKICLPFELCNIEKSAIIYGHKVMITFNGKQFHRF